MASVAVDLEAGLPTEPTLPSEPQRIYNSNANRDERALPIPLQNMQQDEGLRHRLSQGQSTETPHEGGHSPISTEGTMTPGSTEVQDEPEGTYA
jgi:hypothetical protein